MEPLTGDDPAEIGGYRLRGRLGAGGMGRVYLAFTPGGRPVALKVVRPELADDGAFRDGADYSVSVNGVTWTEITKGSATMHYETQDGTLLSSNVSAHGSQTILDDGAYDNRGPLTLNTQPDRYTCSSNSLHIFVPNGGSIELTRSTPPAPSSRS